MHKNIILFLFLFLPTSDYLRFYSHAIVSVFLLFISYFFMFADINSA